MGGVILEITSTVFLDARMGFRCLPLQSNSSNQSCSMREQLTKLEENAVRSAYLGFEKRTS